MKKFISLLCISVCLLISTHAASKKKAKPKTSDPVAASGEVTVTTIKATKLYKIGEMTVSRGSVKHVSAHVGKNVSIMAVIVKNKIIRIKSIVVKEAAQEVKGQMTLASLKRQYQDNTGETIKKYRGKSITYTATATGIKTAGATEYRITLNKAHGQIYINKTSLPEKLNKALWKISTSKADAVGITFTATWHSERSNMLVFKDVVSIK